MFPRGYIMKTHELACILLENANVDIVLQADPEGNYHYPLYGLEYTQYSIDDNVEKNVVILYPI